jgi:hypothetical protein
VEDMERTIVTSYGERRKIVHGNRRIFGHEIELPIAQPGRYRVVVSCCWEEESTEPLLEKDRPERPYIASGGECRGRFCRSTLPGNPSFPACGPVGFLPGNRSQGRASRVQCRNARGIYRAAASRAPA